MKKILLGIVLLIAVPIIFAIVIHLFFLDIKIGAYFIDMSKWASGDKYMFGFVSLVFSLLALLFPIASWIDEN